jgi:hypothetical protein
VEKAPSIVHSLLIYNEVLTFQLTIVEQKPQFSIGVHVGDEIVEKQIKKEIVT